jgi:hypothetical protein
MIFVYVVTNFFVNGNNSEGGSLWCFSIHIYIFIELYRYFFHTNKHRQEKQQ